MTPETPGFVPSCSPHAPRSQAGGWRWDSSKDENGRYRARYRDPLGGQRCETFTRKADAERYLREMQVEIERGRRLPPTTQET